MKRNILALGICLTLLGCTNDEDKSSPAGASGPIYGKWYYKDAIYGGELVPYDDHEPCGKDYIEFYDTDKIRGIDVWNCQQDVDWEGTFSKVDNILIISNGFESRSVIITELTDNKLSYKYQEDIDGDGTVEEIVERFDR